MKVGAAFPDALVIHGTTDRDVVKAIADDAPFPERPDGTIGLGHIAFATGTGTPLTFDAAGTTIRAAWSGDVVASVGIFRDPAGALAALNLSETPRLGFATGDSGTRYALLASSYSAAIALSGTHPIGVVGTLTAGTSDARSGTLAVLRRFDARESARSVLERTLGSWKLPRDVETADDLPAGTWLIAEADGRIATSVRAAVGYSLDFVRTVKPGILAGDIGLKIDAAVHATFGLEVSGRYLVIVGRETSDERVRVQLFKLARTGVNVGAHLNVGVTGVHTVAPDTIDDVIAAVFGVHGTQIVAALRAIDKWTDPAQSVGALVAGLTNEKAQALFTQVTGIDLRTEFDAVRARILDAIGLWELLDPKVAAELWTFIGRLGDEELALLHDGLARLVTADPAAQRDAFASLISDPGFSRSPLAHLLNAAAGNGLLALTGRPDELRATAKTVNAILDAGVIRKLARYVERELTLDAVLAAVTRTDFDTLDAWLVGRLGVFFDKTLRFEDLNEIKDAIHLALAQRNNLFARLPPALNSRYGFDVAATWQRTTTDTALLDVEFDTGRTDGRELLEALLRQSDFARIVGANTVAARLRAGILTHEITKKRTVTVSLPHVDLTTQTINHALARVEVDSSGPGLLAYQVAGEDVVDARNRFRSTLAAGVAAAVGTTGASRIVVHSLAGTWSYQLRIAKAAMGRADFEGATQPFIATFGLPQVSDEAMVGNVCLAFEVTVPSAALGAWFRVPATGVDSAVRAIAIAIQRALKQTVSFYYLADTARLATLGSSAALLTWAAIPPANGIGADELTWDHRDRAQLTTMTGLAVAHVAARLPALRRRLHEARMDSTLSFYGDDQAASIVAAARGVGKPLLLNLLDFERTLVDKAAHAYEQAQAFVRSDNPADALERLADFAGDITRAFNTLAAQAVFVGPAYRPIGQSVFIEAARALDPTIAPRPAAMLTVNVLRPAHTFELSAFLAGTDPPPDEVSVADRLVSLAV